MTYPALGTEGEMLAEVRQAVVNPLVWIVGGYKGKTAAALAEAWPDARIDVFEPAQWAAVEGARATWRYPNVRWAPFGLGAASGPLPMGEWGNDACSMLQEPGQRDWGIGEGWFVEVAELLPEGAMVDLAIFNCEGGELVVLPHLFGTGLIDRFAWLLVQWHTVYRGEAECDKVMAQLKTRFALERADGYAWTLWRRQWAPKGLDF